jgi:hypothetical protein
MIKAIKELLKESLDYYKELAAKGIYPRFM